MAGNLFGGTSFGGMSGTVNMTDPSSVARFNGQNLGGPTNIQLGNQGNAVQSAYSMPTSSYAAGYDAVNRQRYVDQASTEMKTQQANQLGAAQRQAAMQGSRNLTTPAQMINAAANVAGAATQAGWKADDDTFQRHMALAGLANQDRQFDLSKTNAWNQTQLGWADVGLKQQQLNQNQNSYTNSLNNQNQQAQGYNQDNQQPQYRSQYGGVITNGNPYGLTNYSGSAWGTTPYSKAAAGSSIGNSFGGGL